VSTGTNLGYDKRVDVSSRDATTVFEVANLATGAIDVADRADHVHLAGGKLLVIVEAEDPAAAIGEAQADGVEADVWAVARVDDAGHADRIAAAARSGGRTNVGCVRYASDSEPTDGVDGWIGVVRPV